MRTLLMSLLIIGTCLGLDAGECKCKRRHKTEQQKENYRESKKQEKAILHKIKQDEKAAKKKKHCDCAVEVFQTRPADKLLCADHKVKRDSNGDRV